MIAGRMRSVIKVFRPVVERNQFGETTVTRWDFVGRWHCERASLTSRASREVGEMFPDYSTRLNINAAHKPEEHWQIELDGIRFIIDNIELNIPRGFKTLICSRLNQ